MFQRLRYSLARFMTGRYGNDALNGALFVVYLVIWILGLFFRRGVIAAVLYVLSWIAIILMFFRMLSRNIVRRQAENAAFLRLSYRVRPWFTLQIDRIKNIKRHRYRRCPMCKATLRLPIRRGKRTVTCPRCGHKFTAFFL